MKIHVAETATIQIDNVTLTINVEDASKGDVILGKILTVSGDCDTYKVDGVYEFQRNLVMVTK